MSSFSRCGSNVKKKSSLLEKKLRSNITEKNIPFSQKQEFTIEVEHINNTGIYNTPIIQNQFNGSHYEIFISSNIIPNKGTFAIDILKTDSSNLIYNISGVSTTDIHGASLTGSTNQYITNISLINTSQITKELEFIVTPKNGESFSKKIKLLGI